MQLKKWMSRGFFPATEKTKQMGLTLIEIIIVVALIGTLLAVIARNLTQQADSAREGQAKIGMANLSQDLQLYKVQMNHYPSTEQGLNALISNPGEKNWRGPYVDQKQLSDPWGNAYDYTSDGRTFELISSANGKSPIYYPERAGGDNAPAAEGASAPAASGEGGN